MSAPENGIRGTRLDNLLLAYQAANDAISVNSRFIDSEVLRAISTARKFTLIRKQKPVKALRSSQTRSMTPT